MSKKKGGFERMNGESTDETDLNIEDYDEKSGKKRRYLVSKESDEPLCKSIKLTKREIICLIIGTIIILVALVIFAVLGVVLSPINPSANGSGSSPLLSGSVRLPDTLIPQLYHVSLETNMNTFAVNGSTAIDILVNKSTNQILLHAKDMSINSVKVLKDSSSLSITSSRFSTSNDFFIIELGSKLSAGNMIKLIMTFNYTLRQDLVGFYKSSYTLSNGETRYLATTQFEPTDARKAFPCFDEPALKANFSITLIYPVNYRAVSNMPVKETNIAGSLNTTIFETSYKMSTYLVAFVISDFDCSNPSIVNGHIKVRVCARSDVFSSTSYAQSVADIVIGYYEKFFGIDYPLPKQDLFAIPDFAAGAMENWGLITYRETALLYNESVNPADSQQRVAVVVAHELAHQWFGNLVTMSWWDGLWLNEGFASYVEYIGADIAEPSWMMLEQFFIDTVQTAFDADGLNNSHPIIQTVHDPDEINGLFDSISYDKGASLIQMLRHFIGNESFTTGLKNYLKRHSFGNAETHELWDALNESSPKQVSVSNMMDTWTKQMGYPVVTVASNGQKATITQKRFFQNSLPASAQIAISPYNYLWIIPMDYITENGGNHNQKLITAAQDTIDWDSSSNGFIKLNVNQTGFYRVNYDQQNWERLIEHLMIDPQSRPKILSAVDRAGLLEDAFALSSAGLLNITTALNMSRYLKSENDYVPWKTGLRWLSILSRKLSLSSIYGKYKKYALSLLTDITNRLNLNATNLDHLQKRLQSSILLASYGFGNTEIGKNSLALFRAWMNGGASIAPNMRRAVYSIAIATGDENEWNFLWNWYQKTNNPYEKRLCLYALADSTNPWILNRYLQFSLTSRVRSQDTLTVVESVSRNVNGRYLAWNFFRENYDIIFKKYGGGSFSFSRVIRTLTTSFSTNLELKEVTSFFASRNAGSGSLAVLQSVEIINGNIKWIEDNQSVMENWLDEYNAS